MISMEPAVAALLALALLGERLDTVQWLAIGCIVAASMAAPPQRRAGCRSAGAACLMGWMFATYFVAAGAYISSAGGQFGLCGWSPRQESNLYLALRGTRSIH